MTCDYLSMLRFKSNHVSIGAPGSQHFHSSWIWRHAHCSSGIISYLTENQVTSVKRSLKPSSSEAGDKVPMCTCAYVSYVFALFSVLNVYVCINIIGQHSCAVYIQFFWKHGLIWFTKSSFISLGKSFCIYMRMCVQQAHVATRTCTVNYMPQNTTWCNYLSIACCTQVLEICAIHDWRKWSDISSLGNQGLFNIKISSYQYRKSYCGDKTVVRSSYLHNSIIYW